MAEMFDIVSNITSFKKYTDVSNRNSIALPISFYWGSPQCFQMDLQSIRLSSLEQSEQSEQVRIFLLCSIFLQFAAFPHCLSSGCEEYFWKDRKTVSSTSANISWVVKLHIQGSGLWGPSFIFRPNCGPKGRKDQSTCCYKAPHHLNLVHLGPIWWR